MSPTNKDGLESQPHPLLLSESQRHELERRSAQDDFSPENVIPWEQVKAKTLSRLHERR
jgi:putative addiction module component (TIGR02574 family)